MRFYTKTHTHYCGIDLHAKTMYLCILDGEGQILLHKNLKSRPEAFLTAWRPTATISSLPSSACSLGTGSPISAEGRGSSSSSATPST